MLPDENFFIQQTENLDESALEHILKIKEKIQSKNSLKFDNLADPDHAIHENTAFLQTMAIDVEMSHEMLKLIQLCFKNINKHFQRNFDHLAKDFSKIK